MIQSSIDLLQLVSIFLQYLIFGSILQAILRKFLPEGLMEGFNEVALWFRNGIINTIEGLWPENENAEVLSLSRVVAPFTGMLFLEAAIIVLTRYLENYIIIWIVLWIFQFFIFINTAPTVEDWEKFLDQADTLSQGFMIFKLSIFISMIAGIQRLRTDVIRYVPDLFVVICFLLFPLSANKTIV